MFPKSLSIPILENKQQCIFINIALFYIIFKVLKVRLIKNCKIQLPVILFLAVSFTSAYIIPCICNPFSQFLQFFRNSFEFEKIFVTNFIFLMDSLKPLNPINSQNPLSMTKVFCRCSLIL